MLIHNYDNYELKFFKKLHFLSIVNGATVGCKILYYDTIMILVSQNKDEIAKNLIENEYKYIVWKTAYLTKYRNCS